MPPLGVRPSGSPVPLPSHAAASAPRRTHRTRRRPGQRGPGTETRALARVRWPACAAPRVRRTSAGPRKRRDHRHERRPETRRDGRGAPAAWHWLRRSESVDKGPEGQVTEALALRGIVWHHAIVGCGPVVNAAALRPVPRLERGSVTGRTRYRRARPASDSGPGQVGQPTRAVRPSDDRRWPRCAFRSALTHVRALGFRCSCASCPRRSSGGLEGAAPRPRALFVEGGDRPATGAMLKCQGQPRPRRLYLEQRPGPVTTG